MNQKTYPPRPREFLALQAQATPTTFLWPLPECTSTTVGCACGCENEDDCHGKAPPPSEVS